MRSACPARPESARLRSSLYLPKDNLPNHRRCRIIVEQRSIINTDLTRADEYFQYGKITWLTGSNVGIGTTHVKEYLNENGYIQFQIDTPFDIQIGDTFNISAGCDKLRCTCKFKFNNELNYGGFPLMPGNDEILQTPDGKA